MEDWIQKCDSGFNLYHKTDLVTGGSIHKQTERFILMQENCGDIPEKVLKLFEIIFMKSDKGHEGKLQEWMSGLASGIALIRWVY